MAAALLGGGVYGTTQLQQVPSYCSCYFCYRVYYCYYFYYCSSFYSLSRSSTPSGSCPLPPTSDSGLKLTQSISLQMEKGGVRFKKIHFVTVVQGDSLPDRARLGLRPGCGGAADHQSWPGRGHHPVSVLLVAKLQCLHGQPGQACAADTAHTAGVPPDTRTVYIQVDWSFSLKISPPAQPPGSAVQPKLPVHLRPLLRAALPSSPPLHPHLHPRQVLRPWPAHPGTQQGQADHRRLSVLWQRLRPHTSRCLLPIFLLAHRPDVVFQIVSLHHLPGVQQLGDR